MNAKYLAALILAAFLAACAASTPLEPPSTLSAANSDVSDPPHPPVEVDPPDEDTAPPPPRPLPPVEKDPGGTIDRPLSSNENPGLIPEYPFPTVDGPGVKNPRR